MQNVQHDLLPLVVQNQNVLVDARLLHKQLKSGYQFSDWIKTRIKEYEFELNKDYFASENSEIKNGRGGDRKSSHYLLTLDMAKELAMLERNEVGRAIRRYFIAKEKELRGISQLPQPPIAAFKGIRSQQVNGRKMYPYRELLQLLGYNSTAGGCSSRVARYPQHFVKMGNTQLITAEFAVHLHHSKMVHNNRAVLKAMQPVLPFNFAEPITLIQKGGSHASN